MHARARVLGGAVASGRPLWHATRAGGRAACPGSRDGAEVARTAAHLGLRPVAPPKSLHGLSQPLTQGDRLAQPLSAGEVIDLSLYAACHDEGQDPFGVAQLAAAQKEVVLGQQRRGAALQLQLGGDVIHLIIRLLAPHERPTASGGIGGIGASERDGGSATVISASAWGGGGDRKARHGTR